MPTPTTYQLRISHCYTPSPTSAARPNHAIQLPLLGEHHGVGGGDIFSVTTSINYGSNNNGSVHGVGKDFTKQVFKGSFIGIDLIDELLAGLVDTVVDTVVDVVT